MKLLLDLELAVTEIEARVRQPLRQYVAARWRAHRDALRGCAVPPPELADRALWRRLESMRRAAAPGSLGRRIEMVWRLVTAAAVAADPAVTDAALAATDGRGRGVAGLGRLFAARNRVATELGRPDFYSLGLELEELDPATVDRIAAAIERDTAVAWCSARVGDSAASDRGGAPAAGYREVWRAPWTALPALRVDRVGHVDRSRTYLVAPPVDVRVIAGELHSAAGRRALAHELGHACYAVHHDPELPWSLADAPARCLHEAVAELFADAAESPPAERSPERRRARLAWRRWQLARAAFERDGYRRPEGDLAGRYAELVARAVGSERSAPNAAEREQYRADPMGQVSYLVGDYLRGRLARRGPLFAPDGEVDGRLIERLFRPGASAPWRDRMASLGV